MARDPSKVPASPWDVPTAQHTRGGAGQGWGTRDLFQSCRHEANVRMESVVCVSQVLGGHISSPGVSHILSQFALLTFFFIETGQSADLGTAVSQMGEGRAAVINNPGLSRA